MSDKEECLLMRLEALEHRMNLADIIAAERAGCADENNGMVPITKLYEDVELPWTFDSASGEWLRPFVNTPTGYKYPADSAEGVAGRNYVKVEFEDGTDDPVVSISSTDETDVDNDIYCFYVGTLASSGNDDHRLIQTKGVYSIPVIMVYI